MTDAASGDANEARPPPDPEIEALDAICRRLVGFDARLDTEWVDGYLTALAASWREIGIDEWLPALCGDAFERTFADPADVAQAKAALGARLLNLRRALDPQALLDEPDTLRLSPIMVEWDDTARAELVEQGLVAADELAGFQTGAEWAEGFLDAVDAFRGDWPDPDTHDKLAPAFEAMVQAVAALDQEPNDEQYLRYLREHWPEAEPSRDELIDEALFAVQDLRVWWIDHGPAIQPRRVGLRPGRNDPCPCGSGKKYKKCHGAAG